MKNNRRLLLFLVLLVLVINTSCNNSDNKSDGSSLLGVETVEQFFSEFEEVNYEEMKKYCTESCIEKYFHHDNVYGMIWAKLTNIEEDFKILEENEYNILVDVKMETAKTSALYPDTETSFYLVLRKIKDKSFLIDGFVTG